MEPEAPRKEYPRFGRDSLDHAHAPYAIVLLLVQLDLAHWSSVLLGWLSRYDGVEEYLHVEEHPARCTRDLLMRHVMQRGAPSTTPSPSRKTLRERQKRIVLDLLQLDFLRVKAYWGPVGVKDIVWCPLEQSWMAFLDRVPHHDDAQYDERKSVEVWLGDDADPHYQHLVYELLMGIASEHVRGRDDDDQAQR